MLEQIGERVHEELHKLPGMPPHSEAARLNQNLGAGRLAAHVHHPALRSPNAHHARPPRVLVAWQEWIGGLFGAERDRG
jgi:hypothetical protein